MRQRQFTRAVDARAAELMPEYQEKAEKVDRLLGEEPGRGRMRRQLDTFNQLIGLVIGTFNEASGDTLALLDAMAESRVRLVARTTGLSRTDRGAEKGIAAGELRRQL